MSSKNQDRKKFDWQRQSSAPSEGERVKSERCSRNSDRQQFDKEARSYD